MRVRAWALIAAAVLAPACGPTRAGSLLVDASAELAAADTAQAKKIAPYEFTAAESYLHKAREDHSYANFETAAAFARKARDCARIARVRAETETRREMGASPPKAPAGVTCNAGMPPPRRRGEPEPEGDVASEPAPDEPSDPVAEEPRPHPVAPPPPPPPAQEDPLPPGDEDVP